MFISLQQLELRKIEFEESYAPGQIELVEDVLQTTPLTTKGHAELLEEHHGAKLVVKDIRMIGEYATRVEMKCARCLESVPLDLANKFDLLYRPLKVQAKASDEVEIHEADTEISFYQGEGLTLEDLLKEQLLLAVPAKALCQEDCKGLCPQCGQNFNTGKCNCAEVRPDSRWEALAGLKEKLSNK
ncbi:MAG: DUF177 domain-containing protein [Terriglobales bacterium]